MCRRSIAYQATARLERRNPLSGLSKEKNMYERHIYLAVYPGG